MIVKSKYGLDRIVWDDSSLRSQGGQIQHSGSQSAQDYQAILPAYVQGGSNVYKVTARAYDRNGNSSNNVQLTITVLSNGQVVDQVGVTDFTADKTSAKADGNDTITYTAVVKKNGVTQANVPVSFNIVSGTATLSAKSANTNSSGKVTVTLKSDKPGQVVVSAKTAEMTSALNAHAVIFVDQTQASITEINADKKTAKANGSDAITYTVKVMKDGKPLSAQDVTFTATLGTLSKSTEKTDANGYAKVTLTSKTTGKSLVSASISGSAIDVKAPEVEFFTPLAIDDGNVEIVGTGIKGTLPTVWLQYGQVRLKASGGDGKYTWSSANTGIASVDSTGQVTLRDKGSTTITVVSGDKQTATYIIARPSSMIVSINKRMTYKNAMSSCQSLSGRLPSYQKELADVFDTWGAANKYKHYETRNTMISWIKQTDQDMSQGVASTYDLIKENPLTNKVDINNPNAYATCVK